MRATYIHKQISGFFQLSHIDLDCKKLSVKVIDCPDTVTSLCSEKIVKPLDNM